MMPIYVRGVGLWSPGFADAASWATGQPDPLVVKPPCQLVGSRLRRGSSRFANMLGEVVEQAGRAASVDLSTVGTVYGSSLGEIETMVILLKMLFEEEGKLSPNRFKNSVHNAASGLVSIGTDNRAFSTAIAGGARTFEVSLLEAWALLDSDGGDVIVAVADDRPPAPLAQLQDHEALALAFCLSADPPSKKTPSGPSGQAVCQLSELRYQPEPGPRFPGWEAQGEPSLLHNATGPGLSLLAALQQGKSGPVFIGPPDKSGYVVTLDMIVDPEVKS